MSAGPAVDSRQVMCELVEQMTTSGEPLPDPGKLKQIKRCVMCGMWLVAVCTRGCALCASAAHWRRTIARTTNRLAHAHTHV